jgi:hypothetical protein
MLKGRITWRDSASALPVLAAGAAEAHRFMSWSPPEAGLSGGSSAIHG